MNFLSAETARDWCNRNSVALNEKSVPEIEPAGFERDYFRVPASSERFLWFSQFVESSLRPWSRCLLWVTEWGIWPSSENWHLYYRLRQSYSDCSLLEDKPAHLLLAHETADLATLLHLGLSFGWGMHLLTPGDHARIFVSHDGWVGFSFRDKSALKTLQQHVERLKVDKHHRS